MGPSRRGSGSSQSLATALHYLSPVPQPPTDFDWSATYGEMQVQRERANSVRNDYAYRATDEAIKAIDEILRTACLAHTHPPGETEPIAMYNALQRRHRELFSAEQQSVCGATWRISRDLKRVHRLCHQAAFELDLRARDFADSFPAAASPGTTAANRVSTVANLVSRLTIPWRNRAQVASAKTADSSSRFPPTSSTPGPAQDAAPSLGKATWPADFHALKEERERYRKSGKSHVVGVYDAAIGAVLHMLQKACDRNFLNTRNWVQNEPERAYRELYNLWRHLGSGPNVVYQRRSIATQLSNIQDFAHHKLVQLAGRADEFAALYRATPSPRPPAATADPQALGHWLGSEAALARTRLALMQQQNDIPGTRAATIEQTYFTRLQERLAAGHDPWSASRDFLRELIVANHADSAPLLLPSHLRLLKAMADTSLGKTSDTIQAQAPPASRFVEPQPESPKASGSASLPSVYPGQPEPIRRTPNPAYQPLPAEHGHTR